MYEFFRGKVVHIDVDGNLSIDVHGVGYRLRISEQTRQHLPLDGSDTIVYARLVVRDDDLLLYGFAEPAERAAFDLLTSVQGIGPVAALGILSAFTVSTLRAALVAGDAAALKKVKGVGPKAASRLAMELADKVDRIPAPRDELPAAEQGPAGDAVDEARQALVALGFSNKDAIAALDKVAEPDHQAEELLRLALVLLR